MTDLADAGSVAARAAGGNPVQHRQVRITGPPRLSAKSWFDGLSKATASSLKPRGWTKAENLDRVFTSPMRS